MQKCVGSILCMLFLIATIPFFVQAQQYYVGKFPYFSADYTSYKADSTQSYIELFTRIAFADLQFVYKHSHYAAEYEVDISFYKDNSLIKNRHYLDSIKVQEFKKTNAKNEFRLSLLGTFLEPGRYQCKVILTDNETRKEAARILNVHVKKFDEKELAISDLQFANQIETANDLENAFVKSGRYIEPNVTNTFDFFDLKMNVFYEVYGLSNPEGTKGKSAIIDYKIIDRSGKIKKSLQKEVATGEENSAHSISIAINSLPPGRYTLEVEVKDPERNESAIQRKSFLIGWEQKADSQVQFDRLVEQIEIIATEEEARQLRQIYQEKKRAVILAFWRSKDPSPETLENEIMREFYRRIEYANRHFGNLKRDGWKTDMGRTYVRYGPPDSIQRLLSELNQRASEIWHYNSPENRFHFVENNDLEIFEFVNKGITMRDELK